MASKKEVPRLTLLQLVKDILLALINKGQLLVFGLLVILGIIILRLPPESLVQLPEAVLNILGKFAPVSYVANGALASGWVYHAKRQRRSAAKEIARLGEEKSRLQEQLHARPLSHSRKHKP
jgi:hypothetical protein